MPGEIVHVEIPADDTTKSQQFWGSLSGLRRRSGVTSAANAGDATTSMVKVSKSLRIEPLGLVMMSSRL